jgi:hypothetical protein
MSLNSATLQLDFGQAVKNPNMRLDRSNDPLTIEINGEERSFIGVREMDGQQVGGTDLRWIEDSDGYAGTLQITGRIGSSLIIGGYYLIVDDICVKPDPTGFETLSGP